MPRPAASRLSLAIVQKWPEARRQLSPVRPRRICSPKP
jgi:hypothetical protein